MSQVRGQPRMKSPAGDYTARKWPVLQSWSRGGVMDTESKHWVVSIATETPSGAHLPVESQVGPTRPCVNLAAHPSSPTVPAPPCYLSPRVGVTHTSRGHGWHPDAAVNWVGSQNLHDCPSALSPLPCCHLRHWWERQPPSLSLMP